MQRGKTKCCDQRLTKEAVACLAQNWRKHYEKHIRVDCNQWLLEDMAEYVDQVRQTAMAACKQGLITKEEMQDIIAIAEEELTQLHITIQKRESEDDYIARLCGEYI